MQHWLASLSTVNEQCHEAMPLTDGLYRVTTPHLCAGFVVEGGRVTRCAPILRERLSYWMRCAARSYVKFNVSVSR
jgi:hypothetical protein